MDGRTTQVECPSGEFGRGSTSKCLPCGQNNFSNASGLSSCYACPRGFSNGAPGSTGCNGIPRGSFYNDTDRSESLCPKGYTCDGGGADATPCDPGRYAPD